MGSQSWFGEPMPFNNALQCLDRKNKEHHLWLCWGLCSVPVSPGRFLDTHGTSNFSPLFDHAAGDDGWRLDFSQRCLLLPAGRPPQSTFKAWMAAELLQYSHILLLLLLCESLKKRNNNNNNNSAFWHHSLSCQGSISSWQAETTRRLTAIAVPTCCRVVRGCKTSALWLWL